MEILVQSLQEEEQLWALSDFQQEPAQKLLGPELAAEVAVELVQQLALRRNRMSVVDGYRSVAGAEDAQAFGELNRHAVLREANVVVEGG